MKTTIIECHTVLTMIASCMRRQRNCSSDKPPDRVLINNADATCAGQAPIVTRFNDMHVRRWQQANNAFSGCIDTAFIAVALLISYCDALAAGLMDAWQLECTGITTQLWAIQCNVDEVTDAGGWIASRLTTVGRRSQQNYWPHFVAFYPGSLFLLDINWLSYQYRSAT